jgi:ABC-2 type transport system permease protein
MNSRRIGAVAAQELRYHLHRPLVWIWAGLLVLLAWGLSTGSARVGSGGQVSGEPLVWISSEFEVARLLAVLVPTFYSFFLSVLFGMSVLRDHDLKIEVLLRSTPLSSSEYVAGKVLGLGALALGVLAAHLGASALFNHLGPGASELGRNGPFELDNYLRPALVFALPCMLFTGGSAFALGALWRRPILVFVLPIALLASAFFLWFWSPAWLDPTWNRALMLIDPAGLRWLQETWLREHRGADFYNQGAIALDAPFAASRAAFALFGLCAFALSALRLPSRERADAAPRSRARRAPVAAPPPLAVAEPVPGVRSAFAALLAAGIGDARGSAPRSASLRALGMRSRRPWLPMQALEVARVELKELLRQAGLYLFTPLILLQTLGAGSSALGPMDTPLLATPGTLAVGSMNTLSLLVCLLALFYMVDSLERERVVRLSVLQSSSPTRTSAILFGKVLANAAVATLILGASFLGSALVLLVQGEVALDPRPFALCWALLLPTFLLWNAFVCCVHAATRSGPATHAIGLGAIGFSLWAALSGKLSWATNWMLWSALQWSDFGLLERDRAVLLQNRALALTLALAFTALAVLLWPRRQLDPGSLSARFAPRSLLRAALPIAPFALVACVLAFALRRQIEAGPEGERARADLRAYWTKNVATYEDALLPRLTAVDIELALEPEQRRFSVAGSYRLRNAQAEELRVLPLTVGAHWENLVWEIEGAPTVSYAARSGLHVLQLVPPLAPGAELELRFRHTARLPSGPSRAGSPLSEFVLPSGAVMTSLGTSFAPQLGFVPGLGLPPENAPEPRAWEPGFERGRTPPAIGPEHPFALRMSLSGPAEWRLNGVGERVDERVEAGRRHVRYESLRPVGFYNLVAGPLAERRAEGVALYHHPQHSYNLPAIESALVAARRRYSEWFGELPYAELRLTEFPGHAALAQGFPTNISFSESMGFLTRSDARSQLAWVVTAHEAAHQWWGSWLVPGDGPSGAVLSESMAHAAVLLLLEAEQGPRARMEFARRIESLYAAGRRVDFEQPLTRVDGSRGGDRHVIYDRGGFALWMLIEEIGRARALAGLREFFAHWVQADDHPLLPDLLAHLRLLAPDPAAFDTCVARWFESTGVPAFELLDAAARREGEGWLASARVRNVGDGAARIELCATRGERFPAQQAERTSEALALEGEPAPSLSKEYRESRLTLELAPGEERLVELECTFEPELLLVDPDVRVLQLRREHALARF